MTGAEIRGWQRDLIGGFVAAQPWWGGVLDYGCGDAPYRTLVEQAGARWHGYNRPQFPGGPKVTVGPARPFEQVWDGILCTQMLQYVPDPGELLHEFWGALGRGGRLVLTYATNWPEVEGEDLFRFTRAGMEHLLQDWTVLEHQPLGAVPFGDREETVLGYGVVATP